jgi:hypothetical protein
MKVVKDSYISINFYFVENIQSQMKQTPIAYFNGGTHVLQKGISQFLIFLTSVDSL